MWRLSLAGLRRSEVLGLDWSAWEDDGFTRLGVVRARTSNNAQELTPPKSSHSRRWVPIETMVPGTAALVKKLWIANGRPAVGNVATDRKGKPVMIKGTSLSGLVAFDARTCSAPKVSWPTDEFERIARAAGLPGGVTLHGLRHSIATDIANTDAASVVAGAALLGHDPVVFLSIYAQADNDAVRGVAERYAARTPDFGVLTAV